MVTFKIPYVLRYGTAPKPGSPDNRPYRYRRVVPPYLREKLKGRKSWFKTWRLGTPDDVIQHAARKLAINHDREIAIAKGEKAEAEVVDAETVAREVLALGPADVAHFLTFLAKAEKLGTPTSMIEPVQQAIFGGGKVPVKAPLLSVARDTDIEAGKGAADTGPLRYAVKHFVKVIGDKPVTAITRADAELWLASFEGSAPATVKRRLGSICGLINRTFLTLEYTGGPNPFSSHKIKDANGDVKKLPFSKGHLKLIDDHLAGPRVDREHKNIMNLLRNTGARLSEIGGLAVSDIWLDDGDIPFITIRDNAIRGVKSDAATRRVPLLGVALEAARDAMEHAARRGKGHNPDKIRLFKCFDGSPASAKALSAKCCNVIRAAGIDSKRLTAHSLRHTVVEALRCTEISSRLIKYIVGHSAKSVTDGYGAPWRKPEVVRDALVAALEILGDVDTSIFAENERLD